MAPTARWWPLPALAAAAVLSGCVTTQDRNARAQLRADRILAARKPVLVTAQDPAVRVDRVALVRGGRASAVVVQLTNTSARTLSDLPISVGVRKRVLNRRNANDFFANHVAAMAAHGSVRWVVTVHRRVPKGVRVWARVGAPARTVTALPALAATALPGGRVRVRNATAIPQTLLPVYALSRRGGRIVAAGAATVSELDEHAVASVDVPLVGRPDGGRLQLQVLPTIFK